MTKMHGGYGQRKLRPIDTYFESGDNWLVGPAFINASGQQGQSDHTSVYADIGQAETAQLIDKCSVAIVRLLSMAAFRLLPCAAQQAQLEAMARSAESESGVVGKYVQIAFYDTDEPGSEYGHEAPGETSDRRLYVAPNADMSQVSRMSTVPETLGGICVGLFSLERHLKIPVQIRTDNDLIDAAAGLCLGLEPDLDTLLSTGTKSTDMICVPVSGQNFDAIFI